MAKHGKHYSRERIISLPIEVPLVVSLTKRFLHIILDHLNKIKYFWYGFDKKKLIFSQNVTL